MRVEWKWRTMTVVPNTFHTPPNDGTDRSSRDMRNDRNSW